MSTTPRKFTLESITRSRGGIHARTGVRAGRVNKIEALSIKQTTAVDP